MLVAASWFVSNTQIHNRLDFPILNEYAKVSTKEILEWTSKSAKTHLYTTWKS